ncbi:hypothetical protein ACJRO7_026436 [Eucalyptus globulus]|uniref:Uncharacterized protein n=1 Tax=Eucalyptus globulus TaxID=34317 RepID=A0ABD3JRN6_EUCGL
MEQELLDFLQDALLPGMKGLIAEALFKHCNKDVTVASCLSEILRMASPVQPYNEDQMKACLLMLDLDCEAQILHMCQHFWIFTRSNPSADEYWAMEKIMANILAESEDISSDLLIRLLANVLEENEVLYDDEDRETLNLQKERWEFIDDDLPDEVSVHFNLLSFRAYVLLGYLEESTGG